MKRQLTEWKKICACYSPSKGLIAKTHKQLKKLNIKRTYNPVNKWTNELNTSQ
jgi:hypothetical protein